ncbi:response regulator, partial [Undibacterium sp. Di27W]|uniref:response regulator n=1 Tax=Undibacterium sp. Di27W TaxID=3413036 RepID=UPI003BF2AAED
GLGIGLALVQQITELHGGTVVANSNGVGQGSTFTLRLPLSHVAMGLTGHDFDSAKPRITGCSLLLVDDSEDMLSMFKELLESEGAIVQVASSAKQGLGLLASAQFDVVVSDISMPDMDGFEFIQSLRAMPHLRTLPVIAASGLGRERNTTEAQNAGFSAWLTKPILLESLCDTICSLCPSFKGPGRNG